VVLIQISCGERIGRTSYTTTVKEKGYVIESLMDKASSQ
jgi:hypothetical protein